MNFHDFLSRVIDEGIAAASESYAAPEEKEMLEGALAGFEACRKKNTAELAALLAQARKACRDGFGQVGHWRRRCYEAEIEWVCNVVSAALVNVDQPPIIPPTARGMMKAASILGVRGVAEA